MENPIQNLVSKMFHVWKTQLLWKFHTDWMFQQLRNWLQKEISRKKTIVFLGCVKVGFRERNQPGNQVL